MSRDRNEDDEHKSETDNGKIHETQTYNNKPVPRMS